MFIPPMILMRLITAGPISSGRSVTSWRAPSTRNRTRICLSCGSMWMSEARSRSAWAMIRLTTLTTGASASAPARPFGVAAVAAAPLRRVSVAEKACTRLWMAPRDR